MKTWTILMNPDKEILQMMKDSRWIYDQALYHQRQKFFETQKEGKIKTFNFKELYHIVSQTDEYKEMRRSIEAIVFELEWLYPFCNAIQETSREIH